METKRPPIEERCFVSEAVEEVIAQAKRVIQNQELAWMFENCFPNTLDTTVRTSQEGGKPDTFVITGDINAMWLRDSTAQVWPYLSLAGRDEKLKSLLAGVINRQTKCILIDPYANAFNFAATGAHWQSDLTDMKPELHERKWEVDSLCYAIRLATGYWKQTKDKGCFDEEWQEAMRLVVRTFREQQRLTNPGLYHFQRKALNPTDTLPMKGYGSPTKPCGLIHSAFRPSDDSCLYPFLIPSNLFAVTSLRQLANILDEVLNDADFAAECRTFADEVEAAVNEYGIGTHPRTGENIYAYEVDGFGNMLFMDDANIPSLLALPYLGSCPVQDEVYQRTRAFVLSENNPYFFRGTMAEGVGGPHVGMNMIWPMSIIMRALTSTDRIEIAHCIRMLIVTHAKTGFMHESFDKDDPRHFTRHWFAWANTLFGELIFRLSVEAPQLLAAL